MRALGARAVKLDLLGTRSVREEALAEKPQATVDEATALAGAGFSISLHRGFVQTNRLRTEGADNLRGLRG